MSTVWFYLIVLYSAVVTAINRPVYKIILTQKGYAQFIQYDIETPPLREFTFCSWFRIYDVLSDQTFFTYVANGNNRLVRLWLDSKNGQIKVSIDERVTSGAPITLIKDAWQHICLSYQSDYGAWAVYYESRLISCQTSQSLYGYILPGGGSVIVGYGTNANGAQNGLEGEIFGANMILKSTIERNHTIRNNPKFEQKPFHKNRLKHGEKNLSYIVLNDLLTDEVTNNYETTGESRKNTSDNMKNFIRIKTTHSLTEHKVGSDYKSTSGTTTNPLNDKDFLNLLTHKVNKDKHEVWPQEENLPTLSDYEMPPPTPKYSVFKRISDNKPENTPVTANRIWELNESSTETPPSDEMYEIEVPPPEERNPKVYGQWTSSKFAGNILNYLKSINFGNREQKRVSPVTIPLTKISDSYPYPSNFKARPVVQFQRRNSVGNFDTKRMTQMNLQILEDDLRSNILRYHSQTLPDNVEITNRGTTNIRQEHRFARNVNNKDVNDDIDENNENMYHSLRLSKARDRNRNYKSNVELHNKYLSAILPFLKSLEYFIEESNSVDPLTEEKVSEPNDVYSRSLSLGNKWHNVKSYSNDYTPREIKIGLSDSQRNMDQKIAEANKKNPGIRLRYRHKDRKVVQKDDDSMVKARELAMQVSNQSNTNRDSVSIFKYNHGFLPDRKAKLTDKAFSSEPSFHLKTSDKSSFHTQIKIGNALNERPVIGNSVEQNKRSFVGGDERVPDINKYRSRESHAGESVLIPGSLGPRICKNLEYYDRVLYVHPDESINMSHIMSPVRLKNIGIEFIMENYKRCSLQESNLQYNKMLFIDWNKTPVRLFGGAYPRKTTDLCGFF